MRCTSYTIDNASIIYLSALYRILYLRRAMRLRTLELGPMRSLILSEGGSSSCACRSSQRCGPSWNAAIPETGCYSIGQQYSIAAAFCCLPGTRIYAPDARTFLLRALEGCAACRSAPPRSPCRAAERLRGGTVVRWRSLRCLPVALVERSSHFFRMARNARHPSSRWRPVSTS